MFRPDAMRAAASGEQGAQPVERRHVRVQMSGSATGRQGQGFAARLRRYERLPWPRAALLIGLLSLALWALIAAAVLLIIR
jgi:hypothetical protein